MLIFCPIRSPYGSVLPSSDLSFSSADLSALSLLYSQGIASVKAVAVLSSLGLNFLPS